MSERWRSGLVLTLSAALFLGILVFAPGSNFAAVRRMFGLQDPLGDPADVPAGGTYAFLETQPGRSNEPVTWDPCRVIRYEVNPDGGPAAAADWVADGIAEVSSVSGLQFEFVGESDRRPEWEGRFQPAFGRQQPVLFSWATSAEVDELTGRVAGVGGAASIEVDSDNWRRFVTGGVTLDSDDMAAIGDGSGADQERFAILLHEIGHLVGLGHVDSPRELMFADNVGRLGFGAGDLNGLVAVGSGRCA